MKARGFWQLGDLSDERLVASLRELVAADGRSEARIVAHLAEVDARRIHLRASAPSLFEYCQKQLGLSDNQAYYRIAAARVAQRFPVVFELLERRAIHLTNIAPLAKRLNTENHLELFGEAGRLSKRELLRWLARRYPQPEVSSHIRKLPDRELGSRKLVPQAGAVSAGPTGSLEPRPRKNPPARPRQPIAPADSGSANRAVPTKRGKSTGLADLTIQAKPTGQEHPSAAEQHDPGTRGDGALERADFDRSKSSSLGCSRGHFPRETLRQLVERDEPCCSFVGEDGTRCAARAFLEIDHRQPWAKGGPDTLENLRWLCRAHNQLMAERDFGKQHVQRAIAERRLCQATARGTSPDA